MSITAETKSRDLTTKAMLVSFTQSQWNINRKDKSLTEDVKLQNGISDGWARVNKSIADKAELKNISSIMSKARKFHREQTLPWSDENNQRILPSKNYLFYTEQMRKFSAEAEIEINILVDKLESIKIEAEYNLKASYNPSDYPDAYELKDKFGMKVSICPIPSSADFRITQITDSDIEAIKTEIESKLINAQKDAMRELWERLYNVIDTAQQAFGDPEAGFHASKIFNISDTIDILRRLNIDDDPMLERMCKLAEEKICTLNPSELKQDVNKRKQAANDTKGLLDLMAGYN